MEFRPEGASVDFWLQGVGPGWSSLVKTFQFLTDWDTTQNNTTPVVIQQVKEKFGELRIYYVGGGLRTDAYAEFARIMSAQICEECGKPAQTGEHNGWHRTVCDDHV